MARLIIDLETNGLYQECTKIHCIGIRDVDSDYNKLLTTENQFKELISNVSNYTKPIEKRDILIGHNLFGFDLPVIKKFYGIDLVKTNQIIDTFVLSQLFYGDLKNLDFSKFKVPKQYIRSHSLAAWGHRLLCYKGEYKGGFEQYTDEMGEYCLQDTLVTKELYLYLESQKEERITRDECVDLEKSIAPIIARQCNTGISFNKEKALELDGFLQSEKIRLKHLLQTTFKPRVINLGEVTPKVNSNKYHFTKGATYTKIKFEEYNPSSRKQTVDRLCKELGWTPEEFTDKGNPELDEEIIESLPFEEIKPLQQYYLVDKRLGQLASGKQAWLKKVKEDNRIYGGILQSGTNTGRMSHFGPNLAQVPSCDKLYGKECRQLFQASEGKVLIGCDADSLEMRTLAGYLKPFDGGKFIETVLKGKKENGTDMHTIHAIALEVSRDCSKTAFYGMLYGCKDPKLGLILLQHGVDPYKYIYNFETEFSKLKEWSIKKETGFSDQFLQCLLVGKAARKKFGERLPALPKLIADVTKKWKDRKYLIGLDGRKLFPRSEHSVFNTLNQSCGAIIMKKALQLCDESLQLVYTPGLHYEFVLNVHDEWAIEVLDNTDVIRDTVHIAEESIIKAGEFYKFPCPMKGNSKVGKTWAEIH